MSGSNNEITNMGGPVSSTEPSMEEILASIRRILKDEQSGHPATADEAPEDEEEILVLDSSMAVRPAADPAPIAPSYQDTILANAESAIDAAGPESSVHLSSDLSGSDFPVLENPTLDLPATGGDGTIDDAPQSVILTDTGIAGSAKEMFMAENEQENVQPPHGLVGEAASDAAASSIGSLIRSISSERSIAIGRPGLTLEDLVREELRPLLKSWLDSNLPALVERIVRAEIQRVIERSAV
jgi:cell pole-organizing protein PopZ